MIFWISLFKKNFLLQNNTLTYQCSPTHHLQIKKAQEDEGFALKNSLKDLDCLLIFKAIFRTYHKYTEGIGGKTWSKRKLDFYNLQSTNTYISLDLHNRLMRQVAQVLTPIYRWGNWLCPWSSGMQKAVSVRAWPRAQGLTLNPVLFVLYHPAD